MGGIKPSSTARFVTWSLPQCCTLPGSIIAHVMQHMFRARPDLQFVLHLGIFLTSDLFGHRLVSESTAKPTNIQNIQWFIISFHDIKLWFRASTWLNHVKTRYFTIPHRHFYRWYPFTMHPFSSQGLSDEWSVDPDPKRYTMCHWRGLRENLQDTTCFLPPNMGVSCIKKKTYTKSNEC